MTDMKQLVEKLKQRLSVYLFGTFAPEKLNEFVGLGYYKRPVIWVSLELLENLPKGRSKEEVSKIISEATGWWFPTQWSLVRDSKRLYRYHALQGDC